MRITRLGTVACLAGGLGLLASACSSSPKDPDAGPPPPDSMIAPDAEVTPDAAVPTATRSGTIAVTQVRITNPQADIAPPDGPGGLSGAGVNIVFSDLTTATVPPAFDNFAGTSGCTVFTYDLADGQAPPDGADEGIVSVTEGTDHSPFGCAFNAALGEYVCAPATTNASGALPAGTTTTLVGSTPVLIVMGADFSNMNPRGMYVVVDGFTNDDNNGVFPVVGFDDTNANTLAIGNPNVVAETLADAGTYALLVGVAPVPGNYNTFLDDGTADVKIAKAASDDINAIDSTQKANGQGFTLDEDSDEPHAIPTDGSAVSFTCSGTNGVCGPDEGGATANVLAVNMVATNGDISGKLPWELGDGATKMATLRCSTTNTEAITVVADAMAALLSIEPTRIDVRVLSLGAELHFTPIEGANNQTNILVGQGLVGFTTVPE
jgi:hypothetical protein